MQNKSVALITGANKGIGHQIAKDLAGKGFTVLIGSRDFSNGEAAAKEIGDQAHALQLDVTDQSSIAAAATRIRTDFGRLDVLVNNTGVSHAGKAGEGFPKDAMATNLLTDAPMENIRHIWETNVFGVITVTQAMLPLLCEAHAARVFNMGNTACAGHTATALNNFSGARSVEDGAREAVRLATLDDDGPTGTFSDEDGIIAW